MSNYTKELKGKELNKYIAERFPKVEQVQKYIIEDWIGNKMFNNKTFKTIEDASDFLLIKFPVIYNKDGTQNDRDEDLQEYYIKPINK